MLWAFFAGIVWVYIVAGNVAVVAFSGQVIVMSFSYDLWLTTV